MQPCRFTVAMACAPVIRSKRSTVKSGRCASTRVLPTFRKSSSLDPCFHQPQVADMTRHITLGPSAHVDTFTRDNLPPSDQWPALRLDRPEFQYPERLNVAVELTDRMVERGFGDHTALIGNGRRRTYKELADWSNRLAHA